MKKVNYLEDLLYYEYSPSDGYYKRTADEYYNHSENKKKNGFLTNFQISQKRCGYTCSAEDYYKAIEMSPDILEIRDEATWNTGQIDESMKSIWVKKGVDIIIGAKEFSKNIEIIKFQNKREDKIEDILND